MPGESHLDDLRRRVREDPASIVFARLAEEYRRAGRFREAIAVCRAGLRVHPRYVSARITLGLSLAATGDLDEARTELQTALEAAPQNLAARRGFAELHRSRGELSDALTHYRIALSLSRGDSDLEKIVRELTAQVTRQSIEAPADQSGNRRRVAALRTIARLEQWLSALNGTRTLRRT